MQKTLLCAVAMAGILQGCSTMSGDAPGKQSYTDYVNDAQANRVVTGSGDCLRTVGWASESMVVECQASANSDALLEPVKKMAALSFDGTALFDFDSSSLSASGKRELDSLISKAGGSDIGRIKIVGHADSIGATEYNQSLSERRAVSVQRYLQGSLPDIDVTTSGMGENAPVSDNNTAAGRQRNRRVEIAIDASGDKGMFN